jgi:hypothetical protein
VNPVLGELKKSSVIVTVGKMYPEKSDISDLR